MIASLNGGFDFEKVNISSVELANSNHLRWESLCNTFLPIKSEEGIWRFSRQNQPQEPTQGWKLHISATILEACDLFKKVAPFLISQGVKFKAPRSLNELIKINSGLQYGYSQVGKFITVYPTTEKQALKIAKTLHQLTARFTPISVPFDEQFSVNSSIFYRYGIFIPTYRLNNEHEAGKNGIRKPTGEIVPENRFQAVPDWISDPFAKYSRKSRKVSQAVENPLALTFKVVDAIRQRGKGGTYFAIDLSSDSPRLCIIKEGRRNGEIYWNGQDGYRLVEHEFKVLGSLRNSYNKIPQVFSKFEVWGNFYLVMEYVEGSSLFDLMKYRQRRFSINQTLDLAIKISEIVEEIQQAGWVWNDCKPANLIVSPDGTIRPVDFENSYPINQTAKFNWQTNGFFKPQTDMTSESSNDFYSIGAVLYFLLTGNYHSSDNPIPIKSLRRNVPKCFQKVVENLLDNKPQTSSLSHQLKELSNTLGRT